MNGKHCVPSNLNLHVWTRLNAWELRWNSSTFLQAIAMATYLKFPRSVSLEFAPAVTLLWNKKKAFQLENALEWLGVCFESEVKSKVKFKSWKPK